MEYVVYDPSKHPVVYAPPAVFVSQKTPLEFWNMYLVDFVSILGAWGCSGLGEPDVRAGEPAVRTWGNLPGRRHPTAL